MRFLLFITFFSIIANASLLKLPHEEHTLKNGLKIILIKYPSPGVVAYQLPVHVGSRNEIEKGKTGFAHFFEHLMFRGTKNRSGKEFGDLYSRLGAENNAWTWWDETCYHGNVSTKYLPKILEAEADRFQHLYFDEKALKDEAGAVLGEYNKNAAKPDEQLEEKLFETAFKVHPYGHTTMGYKEDILKFGERYKDVWPFFNRYYVPENVSVILVGDIDFKKSKALIEKLFGNWKAKKLEPVVIPQEPAQTETRTATVTLSKPTQTRVVVAYKSPAFSTKNKDTASIQLLSEVLFSVTSDFQKKYLFDKKWLDSVDGGYMPMMDPGLWAIGLKFSESGESHINDVIQAVDELIASARKSAPESEKVENTKKRFTNDALIRWFESPSSLAREISVLTNFERDLNVINRYFENISSVTPEDLLATAQKYLTDKNKTVVTLKGSK